MIEIRNLTKTFGKKTVLDNISIKIEAGENLAVIGPSGCGKSTLLRLIMRLDQPTAGSIFIDGQDINRLGEDANIKLSRKIGMVFQSSALFDSLTVGENVAFALREQMIMPEAKIQSIVQEKLELVDLGGTENLMPDELSGGMQKRVSFARAIAFNPEILLYDEPTTGLDPITSTSIENLMCKFSRELKTISIVVTHQLSTIYRTAGHIVMLHEGKLIELGSPQQAKSTNHPAAKKFLAAGEIE